MSNHFIRNIFFHLRIRFLHSSNPPLPTSSSSSSSSSYTVDFLVNSCGLPFKSALPISKKFQLNEKTPQNPKLVLQFLKSHHFSDTHLARLIVKCPQILNCRIHDNLKPKFDYLVEIGFEGNLLSQTILSNTGIIRVSLASTIIPNVDFLMLFLDNHDKFLSAVKRAPWLLGGYSRTQLQQNVDLLIKVGGLPTHVVQRLLTSYPRSIFRSHERLIHAANSVKHLGFQPADTMFIHAFRVKIQVTDTSWNNKIELMKSLGFCKEDILKAFKRFPHFLGLSEDNIRKKLNFYFHTMKFAPQVIIVNPALLGYSIEKKIRPRYHVLNVLKSKKLITGINEVRQLFISEEKFQDKFIYQFGNEVPALLEFYLGIKEGKSSVLDGEESALTGESLPVTKRTGDEVFSGSTCKQGEVEAVVIATGVNSFFGKAAHLVDSTEVVGHFQQVLTAIGNFCICSIAVGMLLEIIVMFPIQLRSYRDGINNLLVLLIGGIPIAMPTVLSVTLAIGSHRLSQQGAITKRMTAIEEMAGMDVLCSDKTGTLTLNRLTVDRNLVEVFNKDMDKDTVVLLAARASRMENQDAIDAAIVNMLSDPKEARANIEEVHFLPFNPVDKRTAITYIDSDGNWYRASKGAPEQILHLSQEKDEIAEKVHTIIDKFAERGLRSLAVAIQEVPEKTKDSPGGPWTFCGLLPLFDPPRHDSAETIRRALNLGVCVKMITGDQLAIAKETGRRLGMGTNMYPSSSLLGRNKDEHEVLPVDELIEKADGFAGVFPEHKYEIVKILQEKKHVVGMTGDGVNDAPALKKADIGIAVADATDAARSASDIVLTEPGLSVIVSAVLTSRAIFQRMKNYTIYAVSITIRIVLGFVLLALIWEYDFPPFMVLIIAILNDGTIMTISQDRVKPSPRPDSWKLPEIFATGVVIGTYLALVTVLFYWIIIDTDFFETTFGVKSLSSNTEEVSSAVYLQVSIISQALIFVTRSQSWSFVERPGTLLMIAFVVAQLVATLIAVYANISFAYISGIGWGWAGVIWLYSLIFYVPLDIIKFIVRYALSGEAWNLVFDRKTAFSSKKDYGKEDRAAQWIVSQRSLQGLMDANLEFNGRRSRSSLIAEQARRRAEIARLGEIHTLKGHVESVVRLKNLDLNMIQSAHTV